uniref:glutathione gamma-glutamylcysteinyltransferase n=1 Tax=Nelumbo nucifera TaxID=4432 RepID=A0A822XMJ1_NELNU|nr:TPA_asm: hypothetical protein HUJ06_021448 [Nelumbo nucifera]
MAVAGLYRRLLPSPPAIEFSSSEGKHLFTEALHNGNMEGFFKLICYFQTQSEPAYCGLASLSVVLNALAIDPGRKWKGPWRWFDESMLDCCEPLEKVKAEGITFGKVACLAHCAGAKVEAFRTSQSNLDDFRKYVIACTSSEDCHVITSYHRRPFKQELVIFHLLVGIMLEGIWHLFWMLPALSILLTGLHLRFFGKPMSTIDEATGHHRGFMLISKLQRGPSLLYTLSCRHESWVSAAKYLIDDVPLLLKSEDIKDVQKVLSVVFKSLPINFREFIKWVAEVRRQEDGCSSLSEEENGRLSLKEEILKQVQETQLYKHVADLLSTSSILPSSHKDTLPEIAADVCCQGAELLAGKASTLDEFCCRETCVKCLTVTGDLPATVVSGSVVTGNSKQGIDMLVPSSQTTLRNCSNFGPCKSIAMHPGSNDVLTALLLALPQNTWSGIRDEKLQKEICSLVSAENLPPLLQEEVLHLRQQFHFLMTDIRASSSC